MTFAAVLAFIQAIPILDKWFEGLAAAYVSARKNWILKENHDAIKKAFYLGDQRDLEEALGSTKAGEISGIPGTSVVDSLPGLPKP